MACKRRWAVETERWKGEKMQDIEAVMVEAVATYDRALRALHTAEGRILDPKEIMTETSNLVSKGNIKGKEQTTQKP